MKIDPALERAFGVADPTHFAWQTGAEVVAERERELLSAAFLPLGERVLDLGCAEGETLRNLGLEEGATGVDIFHAKLTFARGQLPRIRFVAASADALPFPDAAFDHVLVRDLLHHLEAPRKAIRECRRVLAPGGRLDVLEPCRNNPLIAAHALLNVAERGELRVTPRFLRRLLAEDFRLEAPRMLQPLPLHRLVFHPSLGRPSLAANAAIRRMVNGSEWLARYLMPKATWAYIHLRGVRA